ncbi:MAG: hypothetical protein WA066_02800 [Candidatus Omnitrophota bacterium]
MTANENRINKGIAFDILHKLGYENVYASDSGNNVIIVTDTEPQIDRLSTFVYGTKHDTRKKSIFDFFVSLGKQNMKILNNLKGEK